MTWRPRFRLWQALVALGLLSALATFVVRSRMIDFRYVVMDENNPLTDPVVVASVEGNGDLVLADGRRIRPHRPVEAGRVAELVRASDMRVDLEIVDIDTGGVTRARVFVRGQAFHGIGGVLG